MRFTGRVSGDAVTGVLSAIGATPMIELRGIRASSGARVLMKWEPANPTGSMKDRMAVEVIRSAAADGRLPAGGTVVEYTAGTTGVSLAFVCAALGYRLQNVIFVRSARIATLDAADIRTLMRTCWQVHERIISALEVQAVVCLGHDAGQWVKAQLGADASTAIETYIEDNARRWRSTTHRGRDGIQGRHSHAPERCRLDQPPLGPDPARDQRPSPRRPLGCPSTGMIQPTVRTETVEPGWRTAGSVRVPLPRAR